VYSGGVFAVASALILFCQFITKILVSQSFYESWKYVPILIIATSYSCIVNFLASVYMAEKKSLMSLLTASSGAVANVLLGLLMIPKFGANGAAIATVLSFLVVFITRGTNTRKYVKINFKLPFMILETLILITQSALMLYLEKGIMLYVIEAALFAVMLFVNIKPIMELVNLVFAKFLKRGKNK
ncbi:MAG: polysaccharide biosynthesis C-terminal domain-containing protein, partial [Eubacterium sp.]|nr:polysaccharide biosynthesis C-terminal domain-containing protein [Eubacterium sp.]